MIVLAEKKDLAPIVQYQETDSFACRILCIANMYGNYPFADFWIQKQEETGHPTAYLSKMDGVITLFAHENADFGELCMFIKTIGASCMICHASCAEQLHITPARTGIIMKWNARLVEHTNRTISPNLHQVYSVLQACIFGFVSQLFFFLFGYVS